MPYQWALHEREVAVNRCKAVLPRTRHGVHFVSWLVRVAHFCATAQPICVEQAQRARLPRARAASLQLWSLHALWKGTALHERGAAMLRCRAVIPHSSSGAHFVCRLARVARLCATALPLSGEDAQHGRSPRARAATRRRRSLHAAWKGTPRARGRPSSVQGRAPTCQPWRPLLSRLARVARLRATALALSGEEAQRARLPRARSAMLAVVASCPMKGHCTSEGPPFFGARPCSHVSAAVPTSGVGLRV